MHLIAFTGKKQTGKSTACKYLEEKYGFTRVNFKDALIAELKQNFPDLLMSIMKQSFLNGDIDTDPCFDYILALTELFQNKPPPIRTLMQNYGTNVRRRDKDSYWVDEWKDEIEYMVVSGSEGVTVDDCRFLNEAEAVKQGDGIIIRLVRTDMTHTDTHQSETEMDSIVPDFTIVCNGGDEDNLYTKLDEIMVDYKQ